MYVCSFFVFKFSLISARIFMPGTTLIQVFAKPLYYNNHTFPLHTHPVMSDKELVELKEKNINIYELLEIPNSSNENEIKKSYRKKALVYHPDKNPSKEAVDKFHLIKLALNILLDKTYRNKYDSWLKSIEQQLQRSKELSNNRKRMLDELEKSEALASKETRTQTWNKRKATQSQDIFGIDLEKLREEGMLLRKKLHQKRDQQQSGKAKSSYQFTGTTGNTTSQLPSVLIKWKVKPGIDLTPDILESILSVFGDVKSVEPTPSDDKYAAAIVTFKDEKSYQKSISYDIDTDRSKAWEGTPYRKLSSLLRDIRGYSSENGDELYEFMISTLDKLKDYKRNV